MPDFAKIYDNYIRETDAARAGAAVTPDGQLPTADFSQTPATAKAVLRSSDPVKEAPVFEEMGIGERMINAVGAGWHNRLKSEALTDAYNYQQMAEGGLSALVDEEEEDASVGALMAKDTKASRDFKAKYESRAEESIYDLIDLQKEDSKYAAPAAIQNASKAAEGKGFIEGVSAGLSEIAKDPLNSLIYLGGSSFGAIAPEIGMSIVPGIGIARVAKLPTIARAVQGAIMASGSYNTELGSYMLDKMQEQGVDLQNADSIKAALSDPKMADLYQKAKARATVVAALDGASGALSSIHVSPSNAVRHLREAASFYKEAKGINMSDAWRLTSAPATKTRAAAIGKGIENIVTQAAVQGVAGGAGEALGSLAAGDEINWADVLFEAVGELVSAPTEVLTLSASVNAEFKNQEQAAATAKAAGDQWGKVTQAVAAMATKVQNGATVQQWANDLGQDRVVFAFAQDLIDNGTAEKIRAVNPELADRIEKVAAEKSDIAIPVSDVVGVAAKDEALAQSIVYDSRVDPAGMTPRQADEFQKTGKEEAAKAFAKVIDIAKPDIDTRKAIDTEVKKIRDQLVGAGTAKEVADLQVMPWGAWLATRCATLGKTPEEVMKTINLRIQRGEQNNAARLSQVPSKTALDKSEPLVFDWGNNEVSRESRPGAILDAVNFAFDGAPVATLEGTEFQKSQESLVDRVLAYYTSQYNGVVRSPEIGDVVLNRVAVKDSIAHGIGAKKAAAFAAVPMVITNGKLFGVSTNWKGRGQDAYMIAAPILIGGERYLCEVVVQKRKTSNRFYLHEVNLISDVTATLQDHYRGGQQPSPARPVRSILVRMAVDGNVLADGFKQPLSSRYPTAKNKTEDADTQMLYADYETAKTQPAFMEKNAPLLKTIPGMASRKRKPEPIAEEFIERAKQNLLFLFDLVPEETRSRAKLWYDGGRRMSQTWAQRYGIATQTAAAVIAVLSPQKGWFENVSMGERILDAVTTKRDFVWDEAMTKKADAIANDPKIAAKRSRAEGKSLGELLASGDYEAASIWMRCYDQAHNDSGYRILSPEGGAQDYARTKSGNKASLRWQSYDVIAKAISCIEDPRLSNISLQLGGNHKVRNFYNNIAHPELAEFATIDTHAVAAVTLIPLAAKDVIVDQNFGGKGSASSAVTGLSGTYPFFLEAYKRAAAERGVLPREMQSITWEAIRAIYTDKFKTAANKQAIVDIWKSVDKGETTADDARKKVVELAGGLKKFAWEDKPYDEAVGDTYDRAGVDAQIEVGTGAVNFEVAPDPDNKELTDRWNDLPLAEKTRISEVVANAICPKVLQEFEAEGSIVHQVGGYLGETNPSLSLLITKGPQAMPIGKMLGYVLNQKSMMVTADRPEVGTDPTGAVLITIPDGYSYDQLSNLYSKLWELKGAKGNRLCGGFSARGNTMTILNFTGEDDQWLADKIKDVVSGFDVATEKQNAGFPSKEEGDYDYEGDSRANNLRNEATQILYRELDSAAKQGVSEGDTKPSGRYNAGNREEELRDSGTSGGQNPQGAPAMAGSGAGAQGRRDQGSERGIQGSAPGAADAEAATRDNPQANGAEEDRVRAADAGGNRGERPNLRSGLSVRPRSVTRQDTATLKRYGTPIDGASSVLAVHFSMQERPVLDSSFYGTGMRGKEAERLADPQNEDIRHRTYFYVDSDAGIIPESGVGLAIHSVWLDNVYNTWEDPLGLVARAEKTGENEERLIKEAGFDGYYIPYFQDWQQGVVCLVGDHKVEVDFKGNFVRPKGVSLRHELRGTAVDFIDTPLTDEELEKVKNLQEKYGYRAVRATSNRNGIRFVEEAREDVEKALGKDRVSGWRNVYEYKNRDIEVYQIAYHGTPYQFDKFTLDHIGTGEGAQSHGWGLYFALSKKVAEHYRDHLTALRTDYTDSFSRLLNSAIASSVAPWRRAGFDFSRARDIAQVYGAAFVSMGGDDIVGWTVGDYDVVETTEQAREDRGSGAKSISTEEVLKLVGNIDQKTASDIATAMAFADMAIINRESYTSLEHRLLSQGERGAVDYIKNELVRGKLEGRDFAISQLNALLGTNLDNLSDLREILEFLQQTDDEFNETDIDTSIGLDWIVSEASEYSGEPDAISITEWRNRYGNIDPSKASALLDAIAILEDNDGETAAEIVESVVKRNGEEVRPTVEAFMDGYAPQETAGHLYTVDIPEDDVMLREDATYSQQPDAVREAIDKILGARGRYAIFSRWGADLMTPAQFTRYSELIYQAVDVLKRLKEKGADTSDRSVIMSDPDLAKIINDIKENKGLMIPHRPVVEIGESIAKHGDLAELTGEQILNLVQDSVGGPKAAAEAFREHGVMGVRYKGQRDGECAVVWSEEAIKMRNYLEQSMEKDYRGSFVPSNAVNVAEGLGGIMRLMESSDKSTFLHESAHAWLDADTMLAKEIADKAARGEELTEGEKRFLNNLGGFFRWGQQEGVIDLGVTDDPESVLDAARRWASMTTTEQTGMHELFAEGFESYLLDGVAPNNEMRSVFGRFKHWLMNIYQQATRRPRPISHEVRKLFDLMFATEQQAQQTETRLGLRALLLGKDAKQVLGLSDEEVQAFKDLDDQATAECAGLVAKRIRGTLRLYGRIRKSKLRELRQTEKAAIDKKEAELREEPRYIAVQLLTSGIPGEDGKRTRMKLSRSSLVGIPVEAVDNLSNKGFIAEEGGVPIEALANAAGTTDAFGLIGDLLEISGVGDARVEAERFVAYQQAQDGVDFELTAEMAAHNATRSRFLTAEYNAVARAIGSRQVLVNTAREVALEQVGGMKVSDLYPSAYMAAERRCAKDAEVAMSKGDIAAVLEAKRGQIMNHEMARAALEAHADYTRLQRAAKRAAKSATIHPKYKKVLFALLDAHSVNNMTAAQREQFAADAIDPEEVEKIVASMEEAGTPIEGLRELLMDRRHARDMVANDVRDLYAVVKQIETIGRNVYKQNLINGKRRISDIVDECKEAIKDAADEQGREANENQRVPMTRMERLKDNMSKFLAEHMKISALCRIMDRNKDGGVMWRTFVNSANQCATLENSLRQKIAQTLAEKLLPVFKRGFEEDPVNVQGFDRPFTHGMRIAVALNWGNESNRKRLLEGDTRFTPEALAQIFENLTEDDWRAVESVWNAFEELRPMVAAKEERVYGTQPEWIDYSPFAVKTAEGKTITVSGGYYPVKFDPRGSNRAGMYADAETVKQEMQGAFQSATTRRSFTKSRVKGEVRMPLRLDLAGLYEGFTDVIHDLAWHEWLIDTGRVLRGVDGDGTGVRKAINDHYGHNIARQFEDWRKDIATGGRDMGASDWIARFSRNVGVAAMGYSLTSAIVQMTGIGYVVPRVGFAATTAGLVKYLANPVKARRNIDKLSEAMRLRGITQNREISQIKNRIDGKQGWLYNHAYTIMQWVQNVVDSIAWMAAYERYSRDGFDNDDAVRLADQLVIDTQSSGNISDLSSIERNRNLRIFTVFYSFMNAALNLNLVEAMGEKNRAKAYAKICLMSVIMPIAEGYLRESIKAGGDDDDLDEDEMIIKQLRKSTGAVVDYNLGLFFLLREVSSIAKGLAAGEPIYGYSGPAGVRAAGDIAKLAQAMAAEDPFTWAALSATVNLAGDFTGAPSVQINRTIKGIRAIESGQAEGIDAITAPLFGYSGRIDE